MVALLQDTADTIKGLVLGVSAHQKLELLERLLRQLGYESVTVFGDCFDEVSKGVLPSSIQKSHPY
jgi:hypothetical protein